MYTDKIITCRDCGQDFAFTSGEQEFFASRGFTNEPSRCPACRAVRKSRQAEMGDTPGYGGGYERRERQMYPAICSDCGKETQVPFQPRGDRPVYCSDCFALQRGGNSGGGYASNRRDRW